MGKISSPRFGETPLRDEHRFIHWEDLGMRVFPSGGTIQTSIYYDMDLGRWLRIDVTHGFHMVGPRTPFTTTVSECDSNLELREVLVMEPYLTREEALNLVGEKEYE